MKVAVVNSRKRLCCLYFSKAGLGVVLGAEMECCGCRVFDPLTRSVPGFEVV